MSSCRTIEPMYSFQKRFKKADHVRRYTIQNTEAGWEVREEQDAEIVRHNFYQDWHRVERARVAMALRMSVLRDEGWSEV
jgi:hypothetical protein